MRIALVTETFPPEVNGVARTLEQLVEGLLDRGHELQLVRPRRVRATMAEPRPMNARWHDLWVAGAPLWRYQGLHFGLPSYRKLLWHWRHRPPEVVHLATEGPLGLSALLVARRLGIPVGSGFHTNFHLYLGHYGLRSLMACSVRYLRWFHNRAGFTLVPAVEVAEQLEELGFERLRVLGRGVDTRAFSPAWRCRRLRSSWGAGDDDLVVAYVGRLAGEKNLDLAVRAAAAMRRSRSDCRFVVIGAGPAAKAIESHEIEPVMAGMKVGEELSRAYASADVLLFPSLTETFGNVVLEGLSSGLAVVSFDRAAARLHIRDGVDGLKAAPGSAADFVRRAQRLATDNELRARLSREARRSVGGLDWQGICGRFEQLLQGLSAAASKPALQRSESFR
nr:GDP-mannose-dependent alpha-mannosyltransferase-like [Nerophis lumbriciformis]